MPGGALAREKRRCGRERVLRGGEVYGQRSRARVWRAIAQVRLLRSHYVLVAFATAKRIPSRLLCLLPLRWRGAVAE